MSRQLVSGNLPAQHSQGHELMHAAVSVWASMLHAQVTRHT